MSDLDLHPINNLSNKLLIEMLYNQELDIEQRVRVTADNGMFTFWDATRKILIQAADEIQTLKKKIAELEKINAS